MLNINSPVSLHIGAVPEEGRADALALLDIEQTLLNTMRTRSTREQLFETLVLHTEAWLECHGKLVASRKENERLKAELRRFQ